MYFELQLSANAFARIVRNRLKALHLCIDRELLDSDGTLLVVDQVVIGSSTTIQQERSIELVGGFPQSKNVATHNVWILAPTNHYSVTVPFLQVKQEVLIHLVKSSDLDANGANPTPPFRTLTIHPVFNVALRADKQTQGGGPLTLSYSLAHVDLGLLALALSATQRAEIEQAVAAIQLPPTTVDLGPLTALLKRPVAAINAGIACDPNGTFVALRADFDIYASPVALDQGFFVNGPANLLGGRDWAMLIDAHVLVEDARTRARNALQAEPALKLGSGPDVSWDPGGPAINITADVELVDACPFFVDDIDMDVDVDIRTSLSVPQPNTLRTHFHLTGEPSDVGEEIACAVTGALLWPFIGPVFLKGEDVGEGVGAYLAGLAGGPLVVFIGIIAAIETKTLTKDISTNLGSTCQKQDDENYECNDVLDLRMSLSPPFVSRLDLQAVSGVPAGLVLSGGISNLNEFNVGAVTGVHARGFTWQVAGRCRGGHFLANRASGSVAAVTPARMCYARVISDPAGEFALIGGDNEFYVEPLSKSAYTGYPCRVRLITNRGVRTLTFPPPAAITAPEQDKLTVLLENVKKVCAIWRDSFHLPEKFEQIEWRPVPRPNWQDSVHFWQIVVSGIQPEETIHVREGRDGAAVMTARASRAGVAHLSMMFDGDRRTTGLSLELSGDRAHDAERPEMSVQQVLFEHQAKIPVSGDVRAMRFEGGARDRRLIVEDAEQRTTWDVSEPLAPALLRNVALEGDTREALVVHSGKRVGAETPRHFRRALQRLQDRHGRPETVGTPRIGGIDDTLYLRTPTRTAVYDIGGTDEPSEMQVYERPAWFEGVALGGNLMARHNPRTRTVDLYFAAVSETI